MTSASCWSATALSATASRSRPKRQASVKWSFSPAGGPRRKFPPFWRVPMPALIHLKKCELFTSVMPSKIFETMAMGRPIIMGVRGEACDIVMEAHAGMPIEPDSPESLMEAVETLADNPDLARKLGTLARGFVAAHYDRDVPAQRFSAAAGESDRHGTGRASPRPGFGGGRSPAATGQGHRRPWPAGKCRRDLR